MSDLAFGLIPEWVFLSIVWAIFLVCMVIVVRTHMRLRRIRNRKDNEP